jgi:hypothetical protein
MAQLPDAGGTGFPAIDVALHTPAEIRRVGDHTVEIHRDPTTHIAVTEEWRKDGKLDRADGPAYIARDPKTGVVGGEEWYKGGKNHRIGGPASIGTDTKTGVVFSEAWYVDGKLHRDGGPAWIHRDQNTGVVITQAWAKNGVPAPDFNLVAWPFLARPARNPPPPQADDPAP